MVNRIAREVGEAARVIANELPARFVKTSHTDVLVQIAKRLQRMQTQRAKARKELKRLDADIRQAKRELRALAGEIGRGE